MQRDTEWCAEVARECEELQKELPLYRHGRKTYVDNGWVIDNMGAGIYYALHDRLDLVEEQRKMWEKMVKVRELVKKYFGEDNWREVRRWMAKNPMECYMWGGRESLGSRKRHIWEFRPTKAGICSSKDFEIPWSNERTSYSSYVFKIFEGLFQRFSLKVLFDVRPYASGVVGGVPNYYRRVGGFPDYYGVFIEEDKRRLVALRRIMPAEDLQKVIWVMARDPSLFEAGERPEEMIMRRS